MDYILRELNICVCIICIYASKELSTSNYCNVSDSNKDIDRDSCENNDTWTWVPEMVVNTTRKYRRETFHPKPHYVGRIYTFDTFVRYCFHSRSLQFHNATGKSLLNMCIIRLYYLYTYIIHVSRYTRIEHKSYFSIDIH